MLKVYKNALLLVTTIKKCSTLFKFCCSSLADDSRDGRPKTTIIPQMATCAVCSINI